MTSLYVVGGDPGPVPGIAGLDFRDGVLIRYDLFQCNANVSPWLLKRLLDYPLKEYRVLLAIELFVLGPRAQRSGTPRAGATTRELITEWDKLGQEWGVPVLKRNAAMVKSWATDARLERAGLLAAGKAVGRHCTDGIRHALYAACHDGGVPDPLSKRWGQS